MFIKNYQEITVSEGRKKVLEILEAGLAAIQPRILFFKAVGYNPDLNSLTVFNEEYNIWRGRIFVIGGGKATSSMAVALEEIIGPEKITAGVVNGLDDKIKTQKIKIIKAGHPLPDRDGQRGVEKMLELKEKYNIGEKDLVICLLSGGASALLPAPAESLGLRDLKKVNKLLLASGADIREINIVRKHLSRIKGGRLAQFFAPARVVSLIISDVPGGDASVIASGPTAPDPTTFVDAYEILFRYGLWTKIPAAVRDYISAGRLNQIEETPKKLNNAVNYIIGGNTVALEAMALSAKSLGLKPLIVESRLKGEIKVAVREITREIIASQNSGYNALLFGGEVSLRLPLAAGRGGRNLHLAALMTLFLRDYPQPWTLAALASDGADYEKEAAGAIVDNKTYGRAETTGSSIEKYLAAADTYRFFKKIGQSLIITGPTNTNVADLMVFLRE